MENNKFGYHSEKLKIGLEAVSLASSITRKIQNALCADDILTKTDSSPVTIADFAAQTVVNSTLSKYLPQAVSMVSEEEGANLTDKKTLESVMRFIKNTLNISNYAELKATVDFGKSTKKTDKFWTLDPIDGTKGFIRGQQYAISLAYVEEEEIQLGILGCPNLNPDLSQNPENINKKGSLLFATKNHGTWSTDIDDPCSNFKPILSSPELSLEELKLCESVEAAHSKHSVTKKILDFLNMKKDSIKLDSQVKYAVVARGQGHIYLRIPTSNHYKEKIWDHAAGCIIAEEAGLVISDIYGKKLDFNCGDELKRNSGIVCAPKKHHDTIIRSIEKNI